MEPSHFDPVPKSIQEKAQMVLDILSVYQGRSRGELQAAFQDAFSLEVKHKLLKGLAKIAMDSSEFSVPTLDVEPKLEARELRALVFERAVQKGPIALKENQFERPLARDILAEIASELKVSVDEIERFFYADQKEMNILEQISPFSTAKQLIQRYNLALCQAILLKANSIRIKLHNPSPKWLNFIFRRIKFYRLMFSIHKKDNAIVIQIDGPQSLLKQSSRYGMQFALFLPVLPLLPFSWTLEAEVLWGKKRKYKKHLTLSDSDGLHSHYKSNGLWKSNTEEWFERRYREKERKWVLKEGELLYIGEQRVLIPNFSFQYEDTVAHLEIIGFWQKRYLKDVIEKSPNSVIFAVSKNYAGESQKLPKNLQERVIVFSEVIPVSEVEQRLENTIKNK